MGGAGGSFLYLEDGIPMRAAGFANVNALMDAMPQPKSGSLRWCGGPGRRFMVPMRFMGWLISLSAPLDESGASADLAYGSYGRPSVSLKSAKIMAIHDPNDA